MHRHTEIIVHLFVWLERYYDNIPIMKEWWSLVVPSCPESMA